MIFRGVLLDSGGSPPSPLVFGAFLLPVIVTLATGGTIVSVTLFDHFGRTIAATSTMILVTHDLEFEALFMLAAFRGASEIANREATSFQGSSSHDGWMMSSRGFAVL
jgi:hypothetical protein